jgi:tetratricopeptide (TPR) repeat protein
VFFAPFGPPPFGFDPGFGWGPPQVIVVPRVQVFVPPFALEGNLDNGNGNAALPNGLAVRPAPKLAPQPDPEPPIGRDGFIVISPKKDFPPPGVIAPKVDRVAVAPGPRPAVKFDPFAPPLVVKMDRADADPVKEAARLVRLGREAFAEGEFGTAGQRFGRAAAANPKAAEPLFLKAQAAFAAGAYADAVTAIRAGLAISPEWPGGAFDPKEPYGVNVGAFAEHLAELRRTVAANPGDPALEFLLGYELWFVGEKVEAKKWFATAAKRLADPGPIELFK